MIINDETRKKLEELARPLIEFLNDETVCHPHITIIVTCGSVEMLEGVISIPIEDYIKD